MLLPFFSTLPFYQTEKVVHLVPVELVTVNIYVKMIMNRYFPALQMIILWISLLSILPSSAESALLRASANKVSNTLIRYTLSSYDLWYSVAKFRHCILRCHFVDSGIWNDTNNLRSSFFHTIGDFISGSFRYPKATRRWGWFRRLQSNWLNC